MLELPDDVGPIERFSLAEVDRVTKGAELEHLTTQGWAGLSQPVLTPLTRELIGKDADLLAFWKAEKDTFRYHYVVWDCSFAAEQGPPFEKAWAEVELTAGDGEVRNWSMDPKEVVDKRDLKLKGSLGSGFKLIKAGVQSETTIERPDWYLRAYREGSPKPYWEFHKTAKHEIEGSVRLRMVVRCQTGFGGTGQVTLSAMIANRRFLLFRNDGPNPDPAKLSFVIPAEG